MLFAYPVLPIKEGVVNENDKSVVCGRVGVVKCSAFEWWKSGKWKPQSPSWKEKTHFPHHSLSLPYRLLSLPHYHYHSHSHMASTTQPEED